MGVRAGVTLIVGGGFHGKSTVLQALERGHLDHVPGDGRERVVATPRAVKVRAEDGRRVASVDVSAFLADLPGGRSTAPLCTDDASGSTSQAAAIVEACEVGARVLLIDEDTSATNLLVRDERMRQLIPDRGEPITPLVQRVRELHRSWGVSTVMVVGGVGDYLGVADVVVAMDHWRPRDCTTQARALGPEVPAPPRPLGPRPERVIEPRGLAPGKIRTRSARALDYAGTEVELTCVAHLLDRDHVATIGEAMRLLHEEVVDGRRTLRQILDALDAILRDWPPGDLVRPRRFEVAAVLNRLRTLTVRARSERPPRRDRSGETGPPPTDR